MKEVCKSVWVGDISDARSVLGGKKQGFTHVLSMVDDEIDVQANAQLVRKVVPLQDEEVENLLFRLEECLLFIDDAVKGGGTVLVHCYGGHSRSVSVVLAYVMKSQGISVQEALARVTYHQVNKGFLKQLELFRVMGHAVDRDNLAYKEVEAAAIIFHDCVSKGLPWRKRLGIQTV